MIPELSSSQCNWKGNQKGKGTDETPLSLLAANDKYTQITNSVYPISVATLTCNYN